MITPVSRGALSLLLIIGLASVSYASPAHYTLGGLDQLLPFSSGAWGGSSSVVAFNPAGLAWVRPERKKSVGLAWIQQRLTLNYLPRPSGVDVPESIYQARALEGMEPLSSKPLPSEELSPRGLADGAGEQLLFQLSWSAPLFEGLHVGVTSLIPLHRFELQAPGFVDERAQYFGNKLAFERWGDSLEGLSTALGLAYQLGAQVSLGVGLNLSTQSRAQSDVFLGDVNYDGVSYVSPRVEVETALSPFASVEARLPLSASELGLHLSVHAPESTEVKGVGEVQVWGFPYPEGERSIPQRFAQVYRQLPLRAHSGVSWRDERGGGLTLGLGWAQWSQYRNRAGERADWSDQWDLSLGGVQSLGELSLGLDLRWRPSPAPEQIGRTSYVDPDQLALALALSYPISETLSLQFQGQAHRLLPRLDQKDERALDPVLDELPSARDVTSGELIEASQGLQTNNPGYPGYESEGWVWVAQLGVCVKL